MFRNYLKIALRNLKRKKGFAFINIIGLAIGIASFVFIMLFVKSELSYDNFHKNGDHIYRVAGIYDQGGDKRNHSAETTYMMKDWFDTSFPEVDKTVRLFFTGGLIKFHDKKFDEDKLIYADPDFFKMFSFRIIKGDKENPISGPGSLVISTSSAIKYFGNDDPIGKILDVNDVHVKVTAVMQDIPENSHFHGDFVISMKTIERMFPKWVLTNPTGISHFTYIQLKKNVKASTVEKQLSEYTLNQFNERFAKERSYFLQPLQDIHLHSNLSNEIEPNGDILYVYLLAAVALIILLMSCINYMNLSIAGSAGRSAEIGIRKVVGAKRRQLIMQFLGESVILSFIALILSIVIVELGLPFFNTLTGKSIQLAVFNNLTFLGGLFLLSIIVGVIAGSYPALLLSKLKSIQSLKGIFLNSGNNSKRLRKILITIQFVASTAFLVSTFVIYNQLTFMQDKKLGINPEQVMLVSLQSREAGTQFNKIHDRLLQNPNIKEVAGSNNNLTDRIGNWREYELDGKDKAVVIPTIVVTYDFFKTLDATIKEGRDFDIKYGTDSTNAYILNEAAVKFLNLKKPVGTKLSGRIFTGNEWNNKDATIIGVINDFNLASLKEEIQPTVFSLNTSKTTPLRYLAIKCNSSDLSSTVQFIKNTWNNIFPERNLRYTFMDEEIHQFYLKEENFLQIFLSFAFLAIFIACIGLLGISAYTAMERTKEIGIRKVLGASTTSIMRLFTGDFIKSVLIANILAFPLAYYAMNKWLENFAYRIDLSLWIFLLAGLAALLIAVLTVSIQAARVALVNPVESLKYE